MSLFSKGVLGASLVTLDEEDELFFALALATQALQTRRVKWRHERKGWAEWSTYLDHTRGWEPRYHMSKNSFNKLVEILRNQLAIDELQSLRSSGGSDPISPEITVAAGLRFLGGTPVTSVADVYHFSISSARRVIDNFLVAVDENPTLKIRMPKTDEELWKITKGFDEISGASGLYDGAVGALDGWLACTDKPGDVDNPTDYYSGHYQRFGINVQAICDVNLRFLYFAVCAPGGCNDSRALRKCTKLCKWIDTLPGDYYIIGDNAYALSNRLLIPFRGKKKRQPYKRTYNFYLSQLRIRIEMAFGRLTTKWRIFRRNLNFASTKNSLICRVAARLHNYVIETEDLNFLNQNSLEGFGVERLIGGPGVSANNNGYRNPLPSRHTDIESEARRDGILNELIARDLCRPEHNILRNRDEPTEQSGEEQSYCEEDVPEE